VSPLITAEPVPAAEVVAASTLVGVATPADVLGLGLLGFGPAGLRGPPACFESASTPVLGEAGNEERAAELLVSTGVVIVRMGSITSVAA
jgi:hypothetical protein